MALHVETFVFNPFQVNTYIISNETKQCLIIDPGCSNSQEENILLQHIEKQKLKPIYCIATHGHIDHILGAKIICDTFNIPFLLHKNDEPFIDQMEVYAAAFSITIDKKPKVSGYLEEDKKLILGNNTLSIIHLPGHSKGGCGIYAKNDNFLITGDTIFEGGGIGRVDLPGGDYNTLINSIKEKVLQLPENTVIYPGHGYKSNIANETKWHK